MEYYKYLNNLKVGRKEETELKVEETNITQEKGRPKSKYQ